MVMVEVWRRLEEDAGVFEKSPPLGRVLAVISGVGWLAELFDPVWHMAGMIVLVENAALVDR